MSFLKWVETAPEDSSRSASRLPPVPPPRDPAGINSIVHSHMHGSGEDLAAFEDVLGISRETPNGNSRGKIHRPDSSGSSRIRPEKGSPHHLKFADESVEDSDGSTSSSASLLDARSRRSKNSVAMDESCGQVPRSSPLRAVVTPTTVDRNRCSTYDNVDDAYAGQVASCVGKPPVVSCPPSRANRSMITRNSPVQVDHLSLSVPALSHRHRSSPVPRHCQYPSDGYSSASSVHRQSPSSISRASAPSPAGCSRHSDINSGRSTPTVRYHRTMSDEDSRGTWRDTDQHHADSSYQDCDSTDSDAARRRTPSGCKTSRSHRGSVPSARECHSGGSWHQNTCYGCVPSSPRCHHWLGTIPPSPTIGACFSGYPMHPTSGLGYGHEDYEQRIYVMESEKEQLLMQVSVLSDQVEAQNEKIQELEAALRESKEELNQSEQMLRQEMQSRSSLEDNKLDLLSQVSALRIKLAAAEQHRQDLEDLVSKLEGELVLTCACLAEKEADLALMKSRLARNGTITPTPDQDSEIHKLKNALSSVIAANDEKDNKIQELKTSLNRYKKLQELVFSEHGRKASDGLGNLANGNCLNSSLDYIHEVDGRKDSLGDEKLMIKPPVAPRTCMQPLASSSPVHDGNCNSSMRESQSLRCSPIMKNTCSTLPLNTSSALSQRARSHDNVIIPMSKTPPAKRHYGTMPRQHGNDILLQIHHQLQQHKLDSSSNSSTLDRKVVMSTKRSSQSTQNLQHPGLDMFRQQSKPKTSGISFGKGFFRLRSGKRSSSAPELVPQDDATLELPDTVHSPLPHIRRSSSPVKIINEKPKGIKRIFGRLKRTGSENLNSNAAEFKRGGVRATVGPRFGWTQDSKSSINFNIPFTQWNNSMICDWLQSMGLGMYSNECKKWVKNGDQLLKAKSSDLEKELGIKNPLHRKKFILAISGAKGTNTEPHQKVDYHWIVRWLDDIGLPQYKDAFFDARVDGSVLNQLTVEDLFHLKVTNQLHHISIKRGIQVLRENQFDPQCLRRRALPGDTDSPFEVAKWSNHRIMEWLRTVDLSEYAPNLRGSGVHGGLMVYEPRFNADLLASLLNIPPGKTLLRRHLSTQFTQLVGPELMQKKRECEAQSGYAPLSPSAKVKVVRRGQLSLIKKRYKAEVEFEDYICPMNLGNSHDVSLNKENYTGNANGNIFSEQDKARSFLMKEANVTTSTLEEEANAAVNALDDLLRDEKAFQSLAATNV